MMLSPSMAGRSQSEKAEGGFAFGKGIGLSACVFEILSLLNFLYTCLQFCDCLPTVLLVQVVPNPNHRQVETQE